MKSQDVFKLKTATTIQGKKIHIDTKCDVKINTTLILKMASNVKMVFYILLMKF
jgi:hypothetical protein